MALRGGAAGCLLVVVALAGTSMVNAWAGPQLLGEDPSCVRHELDVALFAGDPLAHRLVGWLCAEAPHAGQTVIIASPPALATHAYWDFPLDRAAFSFVSDAVAAGYAVFNYDRIGLGESARPEAAMVTLQTGAHVLHQLVGMLRSGAIGDIAFGKVVLLGNSFGTIISIYESEAYGDADGLINTGVFIGPRPDGLAEMFSTFYPAQLDPKFENEGLPLGYATSVPGTRTAFYHVPAAEQAVLDLDELLKDTATLGEAATFPTFTATTHLVDIPVLSVMGDHDLLFCEPECEPGGPEETREHLFWSDATCLETAIVEDAGHFIQLHRGAAADFATLSIDWLDRRFGAGPGAPATGPCSARSSHP